MVHNSGEPGDNRAQLIAETPQLSLRREECNNANDFLEVFYRCHKNKQTEPSHTGICMKEVGYALFLEKSLKGLSSNSLKASADIVPLSIPCSNACRGFVY